MDGASPKREIEPLENMGPRDRESLVWLEEFRTLFQDKVAAYRNGTQNPGGLFSEEEKEFLRSIGATPQEIFDFVEDWCDDGEPDPETVLAIAKIRREFFLNEQQGQFSEHVISSDSFPSRNASLAGLEWLPRIIEKARAKLRGALPLDLMYGCAADRRFLNKVNIDPAEFLREVWQAKGDVDRIVKFVTGRSQS